MDKKRTVSRTRAPSATPGRASTITRSDGRQLKKLHVYVPAKLGKDLAIYCARTERDKSAVVTDALAEWLAQQR